MIAPRGDMMIIAALLFIVIGALFLSMGVLAQRELETSMAKEVPILAIPIAYSVVIFSLAGIILIIVGVIILIKGLRRMRRSFEGDGLELE